jgi:hypothetical protein
LIRHNKDISYVQLMAKMEQRFSHANETETLQVQFHSASQSPTEVVGCLNCVVEDLGHIGQELHALNWLRWLKSRVEIEGWLSV